LENRLDFYILVAIGGGGITMVHVSGSESFINQSQYVRVEVIDRVTPLYSSTCKSRLGFSWEHQHHHREEEEEEE